MIHSGSKKAPPSRPGATVQYQEPTPSRRGIPAVERVLQALGDLPIPRPVAVAVVREELARWRKAESVPGFDDVVDAIRRTLEAWRLSALQPVINGTGVVIHTNLGRAPLGPAAIEAITRLASNYNHLEFDLVTGQRGRRAAYVARLLAVLCGAEAATVTNNCAAALVLILRHFTAGARKEVLISRGELVQIGGGFRIPDVLESSGARLREVGTTNQTTLADYARATSRETALILKVHRSNFFMDGFVASPPTEALAALARQHRLPLVEDLGSGAVLDPLRYGVGVEPSPCEVLKQGVGLVCFSGDKLLGGPQAGIIAGRRRWIAALKREAFFRALRCDKLILGGLQATVESYLGTSPARARQSAASKGWQPGADIPVWRMLAATMPGLEDRAAALRAALANLQLPVASRIGSGKGQVGGGTLPRATLASVTLDLRPQTMRRAELVRRLRLGAPPVISFVSGGWVRLDLRTVFPSQDTALLDAIRAAVESANGTVRR